MTQGDEALVAVLDSDVVLRADMGAVPGAVSREVRGAENVARLALGYARLGMTVRPALINGVAGAVSLLDGRVFSVSATTVTSGKIVEMDFLADPERLSRLDLTILGP